MTRVPRADTSQRETVVTGWTTQDTHRVEGGEADIHADMYTATQQIMFQCRVRGDSKATKNDEER